MHVMTFTPCTGENDPMGSTIEKRQYGFLRYELVSSELSSSELSSSEFPLQTESDAYEPTVQQHRWAQKSCRYNKQGKFFFKFPSELTILLPTFISIQEIIRIVLTISK